LRFAITRYRPHDRLQVVITQEVAVPDTTGAVRRALSNAAQPKRPEM
jgi:hypothetical protein